MVLEYFKYSLYFKNYMGFLVKFGFYADTNGRFLQFGGGGFGPSLNQNS